MSNKQKSHNKRSSGNNKSKYKQIEQRTNIWLLLPIIFTISVLPFIMKYKEYYTYLSKFPWFTYNDRYTDVFLYYKQKFFLIAVFAMAVVALYKIITDKKNINYTRILIPLGMYALLALLSSLFSKYRSYSFRGVMIISIVYYFWILFNHYYCLQFVKANMMSGLSLIALSS